MTHQIIVDNMGGKIKVKNQEFTHENIRYFGDDFKIILQIVRE